MGNEVKINNRKATVEIIEQKGSVCKAIIDGREYEVDVMKVEAGVYSILYKNQSTNMEMVENGAPNKYSVVTRSSHYDVEVIDALTRYRNNTNGEIGISGNIITTPMPGKVVKIQVSEGDIVEDGQNVITISAMKMESDYKAHLAGIIKKVHVSEGDNIIGNQPLVEIEPLGDK
jgi:biotin carboxyl carrier protein